MIFHIPHASTTALAEIRETSLLFDEVLHGELLRMTDHYTDDLLGSHAREGNHQVVSS
jgi:hypothetical protein